MRENAVAAAGHSLGEFSAYVAAGSLGLEDGLRIVRRRGELMADSGDERAGTMAAVIGLEPEAVEEACRRASGENAVVVPANYNSPGQIVISGDVSAVEAAMAEATALGARKVVPLNVSGAFHSPLMESAREGLAAALEGVSMSDPEFPVVANSSARPVTTSAEASERLVQQLTSPVRWVESMQVLGRQLPDLWLEPGPGSVLCGLLKRIDRSQSSVSIGGPEDIENLVESFHA
jgi:[acyl-carrier-protein] S-malonyltransferase